MPHLTDQQSPAIVALDVFFKRLRCKLLKIAKTLNGWGVKAAIVTWRLCFFWLNLSALVFVMTFFRDMVNGSLATDNIGFKWFVLDVSRVVCCQALSIGNGCIRRACIESFSFRKILSGRDGVSPISIQGTVRLLGGTSQIDGISHVITQASGFIHVVLRQIHEVSIEIPPFLLHRGRC